MENLNTPEQLQEIYQSVIENIRHLTCTPSLQICRDNADKLLGDSDDSDNDVFEETITAKYLTARLTLNILTGEESEEI
jgi:hypothetical protein